MTDKKPMNKEKILILMAPEWASFFACFRFARELTNTGYQVSFVGIPEFKNSIQDHGFGFKVFDFNGIYKDRYYLNVQKDAENRKKQAKQAEKGRKPGKHQVSRLRARAHLKTHMSVLEEMGKFLKRENPDLVLLGPLMMDYVTAILKLKIPVLHLNFTLISPRSMKVPPVYSSIVPRSQLNLLSYLRNFMAWGRISVRNAVFNLKTRVMFRFAHGFSSYFDLKKEVKKYGGKLLSTDTKPRLKVPEFITCPKEFDFPFFGNSVKRVYLGASVYTQRKEMPFNWGKIDKEKPIVYCTLGTTSVIYRYRPQLYKALIDVMGQRPELQLILQVGDQKEIGTFLPLPKNVFVYKWVPHMQVLPHVSVMVCHGGFGTVREAVNFGVPMIVFSAERDDPGNCARVVFHNLGIKGNIKKVDSKIINNYIDRIFTDRELQESVKRMQDFFQQQEGCPEGVAFIEEFLSKKQNQG
jgi:zeaxanthin glucosyltransferase